MHLRRDSDGSYVRLKAARIKIANAKNKPCHKPGDTAGFGMINLSVFCAFNLCTVGTGEIILCLLC